MRKDDAKTAKNAAAAGKPTVFGHCGVIAALPFRFANGQPRFVIAQHRAIGRRVHDIAPANRSLRRQALLRGAAEEMGSDIALADKYAPLFLAVAEQFDLLADGVRRALDMDAVYRAMGMKKEGC